MMNGGGIPPQSATPTPEEEKNPEYLKELQAEKDGLESAYAAAMASATSGQQSSEAENSSDPDSAASKTNHAIKLLEQGRTIDLFYHNFSCYWVFFSILEYFGQSLGQFFKSTTSGHQSSEAENSSDPDSTVSKTIHAIKLLVQGRKIEVFRLLWAAS